nr:AMP-binding protein [candidate division Zixibacteria bacterium]
MRQQEIEIPPISRSVHGAIFRSCQKFPDKTALVGNGGRAPCFSYRELENAVSRLAGGLKALGVGQGDRVGILSENCPEWAVAYLGILTAGAMVVPIDASLTSNELTRFFRVADLKVLFCSPRWFQPVSDLIILNALGFELFNLIGEGTGTLRGLSGKSENFEVEIQSSDPAVLIFTSGTTGDPKGVILTHQNLLGNLNSMVRTLPLYEDDIFLSVLPMHHTFEATCGFLLPLFAGLTIVYARSLKSRDILGDIAANKVTCLIGVPLLFEKIYNAIRRKIEELPPLKRVTLKAFYETSRMGWKIGRKPGTILFKNLRRKAGLGSIRLLVSGGAPLPARVAEWFNMIGFNFLPGYGLTECSPVVSVNRANDIQFGSVGPPLPGIEVEVDDPSADGVGEIKVRGPQNTPGYINNPKATSELLREGWLFTGDLGKIEDGHIYITGRKKNLIVSGGGKNIYPEEIESELNLSENVLESLVMGRNKSAKIGEEIWAVVVPDLEQIKLATQNDISGDPGPEQVRDIIAREVNLVNSRLAAHKRIARFEIRLEELEKTTTKKIKRNLYI